MLIRLLLVAVGVFLVNVPFGFWRAGVRKFSVAWFAAVHAPVPIVVLLRLAAGLDFRWMTVPLFVAAFFGGQAAGARIRQRRDRRISRPASP